MPQVANTSAWGSGPLTPERGVLYPNVGDATEESSDRGRTMSVVVSDAEVPMHAPRGAPAVAALAVAVALVGGLMLGVLLIAFASTVS